MSTKYDISAEHPELLCHDYDAINEYLAKALKFYTELSEVSLDGENYVAIHVDSLHDKYDDQIKEALLRSLDPQFAGLLSAYIKRTVDVDTVLCPLCTLNNNTVGGYCPAAWHPEDHTTNCLAIKWCSETCLNLTGVASKARALIKEECENRGIVNLFLPRWLGDDEDETQTSTTRCS